jgi:hypothetical protein
MAGALSNLLQVILPKKKAAKGGSSYTNTFNPSSTGTPIGRPSALDHLTDIFNERAVQDARALMKWMFKNDPDVSATVHAYLTTADTDPWFIVYDVNGQIDRPGMQLCNQLIQSIFTRNDYTLPQPFAIKPSLSALCNDFRWMLLLRGAIGAELVFDKNLRPTEIRNVDMATIEWKEQAPGVYTPEQVPTNATDRIDLNIPTFFVTFYRRDPTGIYTDSPFISCINSIAARLQVINDLYRIMKSHGYQRLHITVVEEVLRKNAPAEMKSDEKKMKQWLADRLQEINNAVSNLRPDQALATFDSVEVDTINKEGPGKSMDVKEVIETLNAQNQAALKVMATIIGRGTMGVNTASVEARIFSLSAEALNKPVADMLAQILTFGLRMNGSQSRVEVGFDHVELRPATELEPQLTVKQDRLLKLLSYGLISDDEFHIEMFNRPKPDGIEELSGTRFYQGTEEVEADPATGADPLGRSVTSKGSRTARSNAVK